MCPFCYIGKKRFEDALAQFPNRNDVKVEWKSFQLNPNLQTDTSKNLNQFLAEHKGISVERAAEMNDYVTQMAKDSGLEYHLDKAVPANSFDAHRISHLAKKSGVQNELEELLFRAYFTEGKNTADHEVLRELAIKAGCAETEIEAVLSSGQFANDVHQDIAEANAIGVRGVPFFVFDRKFAVSGAQAVEVFAQALKKASEHTA